MNVNGIFFSFFSLIEVIKQGEIKALKGNDKLEECTQSNFITFDYCGIFSDTTY